MCYTYFIDPVSQTKGKYRHGTALKLLEDNARLPVEDIATMLNKSPRRGGGDDRPGPGAGASSKATRPSWIGERPVEPVEAVIELNVSPKKSRGFDEIAATIAAFDEVESVLLMSGGYDLQLVIRGARPSRRSPCLWQSA